MNGIYNLAAGSGAIDPKIGSLSYVDGYSIRVSWKGLESVRGHIDWSPIDTILNLARRNNKFITIRILAGVFSPDWVVTISGVPTMSFPDPDTGSLIKMPVPWNQNYLNLYYTFLAQLANRYRNEPLLYWVAVSGPVWKAATPFLPTDQATVSLMAKLGLTPAIWQNVWQQATDKTSQMFPQKHISLCLDMNPSYLGLIEPLANYATTKYGKRICLQSNGLNSRFLTEPKLIDFCITLNRYKTKATIGFQMAWAAAWAPPDRLGPLSQAIDNGLSFRASYMEIYQDDILDARNKSVLVNASTQLKKNI
jgi:hypothetical protein